MPKKKSSKTNRKQNKLKISFKTYGLIAFISLITFFTWYSFQDDETKIHTQENFLDWIINPIRDNPHTPEDLAYALDIVSDFIPASKLDLLPLSGFSNTLYQSHVYGGLPKSNRGLRVLKNQGYFVGYDEDKKAPAWVAFRLYRTENPSTPPRPDHFTTDKRTTARITPKDYSKSGFDRGHMAPNYAIARCYGRKAQIETFLMSNIVPQTPELNRNFWKHLEHREIKRMAQRFQEIWIITGPIYASKHIPSNSPEDQFCQHLNCGVEIPLGFYNIVIDQIDDQIRALAFIVPQWAHNESPKAFLSSIQEIEQLTDLDFLPKLPQPLQSQLESHTCKRIW